MYKMANTVNKHHLNTSPFHVGIMLIDEFALLAYSSVVEPLRAANLLAGKTLFKISNFPAVGSIATSSNGTFVKATGDLNADIHFDLFLVVAGGEPQDFLKAPVASQLRRLDRHGVTLGGVSGGSVVLAAAGLMENRRMTVHWEYAPMLAELSENLMIERSLYVIDRDRVTCAGGIAPIDMMHSFIARQHGPEFARLVSDWFMHTELRPSGGLQRSSLIERYGTTEPGILDAIELMRAHIGDLLQHSQIPEYANISVRQLNRQIAKRARKPFRSLSEILSLPTDSV